MAELRVCCESGDPVEQALNEVPAVVKYGYPPTGAGSMWEHLRHAGFWVASEESRPSRPPTESSEAMQFGRQFAAAILWTAFRSGGIQWDRKTGLYFLR